MRSWLVVLLLICMPLQWSGVAAAEAPERRDGAITTTTMALLSLDAQGTIGNDSHTADCGGCHHGCSPALLGAHRAVYADPQVIPVAGTMALPASRPADLPERPQWRARG